MAANGSIDPEDVEGLASQLLGSTLTDAILDVVIDMTDHLDAVDVRPPSPSCISCTLSPRFVPQ